MLPTVLSVLAPAAVVVVALGGGVAIGRHWRDGTTNFLTDRLADASARITELNGEKVDLELRIAEFEREDDIRHRSRVSAGLKSWQTRRAQAEG